MNAEGAKLAIAPRPRGGDRLEGDIPAHHNDGIDTLVSALTEEESDELALAQEAAVCAGNEIECISSPIADRGLPFSTSEFGALTLGLLERIARAKAVAVH